MSVLSKPMGKGTLLCVGLLLFAASLWIALQGDADAFSGKGAFWCIALFVSVASGIIAGVLANRSERALEAIVKVIDEIGTRPQVSADLNAQAWQYDERIVQRLAWTSRSIAATVEQLQKHGQQNDRVLQNMVDGVIVVDENCRITGLNPAARRLLQINAEEVLHRPLLDVVRLPEVVDAVRRVLAEQRFHELTFSFVQNERRWIRVLAAPLTAAPRPGVVVTLHDETRLRALEELRREFVANVSHELKTPLASVKGYAETLLMGALEDPSASRRFVEIISQQAARLELLINDMLRLARAQGGPEVLNLTDVPLRSVLHESVANYRPLADRKPLELTLEPVDHSLTVRADREALLTVINNLVGNAVRYTPASGNVKIVACRRDRYCLISVADDGPGIPEADQLRIFERFYRVEKGRDSQIAGTGLGLAIAKNLVASMKGTIELESSLGSGSCFRVLIPLAAEVSKFPASGIQDES